MDLRTDLVDAATVGGRAYRAVMDILLLPGFWLDGDSWAPVTAALSAAGLRPHPLTLPGLEAEHPDRASVTLQDQIDAVVAEVDRFDEPVVLVGHSGGGTVAHAVADARPDRVRHVIYVDAGPGGEGMVINADLPQVDGLIPIPDRSFFEEGETADLDEESWATLRSMARPQPGRTAVDPLRLSDERRYDVPITIVTSTFPSAAMQELLAAGHPMMAELARIRDVTILDLPTGHWPQLTRPDDLARTIVSVVEGISR